MALDMQSQRIRFDPHSGSPQTIDTHFDFPTNVKARTATTGVHKWL
jgi:hypothetical protein